MVFRSFLVILGLKIWSNAQSMAHRGYLLPDILVDWHLSTSPINFVTIERSTTSKAFRCCLITSGAVPDNKRNIRNEFAIQCDDRNSEELATVPPTADRTEPARDMPPVPIIALNNIIKPGVLFGNSLQPMVYGSTLTDYDSRKGPIWLKNCN